jgi:replicative DNA helicase
VKDINNCNNLKSGYTEIDQMLGGFKVGVYLIVARPGMGKTMFALNLAHRFLQNINSEDDILYLADTQNFQHLELKFKSLYIQVAFKDLESGTEEHLSESQSKTSYSQPTNLLLFGQEDVSIENIRARIAAIQANGRNLKVIFIDSLEGLNFGRSKISDLNLLRKELEVPIFHTIPLGRKVEYRRSKLPQIKDLNKNIVANSDKVFFLLRPAYYNNDLYDDKNGFQDLQVIIQDNLDNSETIVLKLKVSTQTIFH